MDLADIVMGYKAPASTGGYTKREATHSDQRRHIPINPDALDAEDQDHDEGDHPNEDPDDLDDPVESDTLWQDEITSFMRTGRFSVTHKDNDCWKPVPGFGDATAMVMFEPSLVLSAGALVRFELDPTSRNAVLAVQAETRRSEGTTAEQHAVIFMKVVQNAKCKAVDSKGKKCTGAPMLKAKPQVSAKIYFNFRLYSLLNIIGPVGAPVFRCLQRVDPEVPKITGT
ncbi:hypothetical protein B0H13DRAFT_1870370 [Mycena leptocephala]|nr:hypothetical protein B0H13DRAFT_1870370 [Mycena leptocephala]